MRNIFIFLVFLLTLQADEDYQLGEGTQVGSLPLYIGGYLSLDYQNMAHLQRYRIDDLAFLAYGAYDKFSYIVELEYKEFYIKTNDNGVRTTTTDSKLYVERLYLDYNLDENYIFRAGKYNSPIGFWNLLPINVLRETTSNPVSSYIIYPKFTTGLDLSYVLYEEGELKLDIMLQNNNDVSNGYNNYKIDKHYGFGISYEVDEYTVKFNGGYFKKTDGKKENLYYALISAKYESDNYQFLTEVGTQKYNSNYTTDYAGYIQGLYRFTQHHIGIIRVESYDDNVNNLVDDIAIVGYTYRPIYPIAIKTEYQFHSKSKLNQFLFSFSVLF